MGAWGRGSFDNDTAADWLYELEDDNSMACIKAAFDFPEGYLDSDQACEALAAAEVLLALSGRARPGLPETVEAWVSQNSSLNPGTLKAEAAAALMRILAKDSELDELWAESDEHEAWRADVEMLLGAIDLL